MVMEGDIISIRADGIKRVMRNWRCPYRVCTCHGHTETEAKVYTNHS
jgi:hypothetical protein